MLETINNIGQWAEDRNLIEGSTPQAQLLKLAEELGEVIETVTKNKMAESASEIGDMLVVLTIICAQLDISMEGCANIAYNKIKDRKGVMKDGIFIKEADL